VVRKPKIQKVKEKKKKIIIKVENIGPNKIVAVPGENHRPWASN
jgi:hypothetical protein